MITLISFSCPPLAFPPWCIKVSVFPPHSLHFLLLFPRPVLVTFAPCISLYFPAVHQFVLSLVCVFVLSFLGCFFCFCFLPVLCLDAALLFKLAFLFFNLLAWSLYLGLFGTERDSRDPPGSLITWYHVLRRIHVIKFNRLSSQIVFDDMGVWIILRVTNL